MKLKSKKVDFFEENSPFEIHDFQGWDFDCESYELNDLKRVFADDLFFLLETEKKLDNFSYFKPSFCGIIEQFILNDEVKNAEDELFIVLKEIQDFHDFGIEIVNLLYLKIRVLFLEEKNLPEIYETIRRILEIFDQNLTEDHLIYPIFYSLLAESFYLRKDLRNSMYLWKSSLLSYNRIYQDKNPILAKIQENLARVYSENGDFDWELRSYDLALDLYEEEKFENKRKFFEIAWKIVGIYKKKGGIVETIKYGLNCIEVLETEAKAYIEELIGCYLMVIEGTYSLMDYNTGRLMIDNCANLLGEIEEKQYNNYKKLLDWVMEGYLREANKEKGLFLSEISGNMKEIIIKEQANYKNDKKYLELSYLQALNAIIEESKLFTKFTQMIPNHMDFLFNFSEKLKSPLFFQKYRQNLENLNPNELRNSLIFLEKLLVLNLNY